MIIAIDGPAGAGKSTLAKGISREMGFLYLDTGAMYRAVAIKVMGADVDPDDPDKCAEIAAKCRISMEQTQNGEIKVILDDRDISEEIRTDEVSDFSSRISVHPGVRQAMVKLQRKIAEGRDIVAEGRDMGSVVFPNADLKIFLDAPLDERSVRRTNQLKGMGFDKSIEQIQKEIAQRDERDKTRKTAPLICMPDAIYINNGKFRKEETLNCVMEVIEQKLRAQN